MLTSLIAILIILFAASGSAVLLRNRLEKMLPIVFCGVNLWLYPFYLCSATHFGLLLLCAAAVLLFGIGLRRAGSLCAFSAETFTPGTVVYLVLCLLFVAFFSGNSVTMHDELRLWGAVPKAIHETGKLQLGHDSPIFSIMQSYPPALPLLGYFFTAFEGQFSEGALYVGYACMALSFFIPAFSDWDWGKWRLLAPAGLAILLIPIGFTSHFKDTGMFGMSLFVDPLLGIVMGYSFVLAGRKPQRNTFRSVSFALVLCVLCLLKNTGIVFAATAVAVFLILERKEWNRCVWLPILALPAGIGSWKLLLLLKDIHDLVPLKLHWPTGEEITNTLGALFSAPMVAYKVPLGFFASFVFVYAVMWGVFIACSRKKNEKEKKRDIWIAAGFLLSAMMYIVGYALIYGKTLESFARYMAALLLGFAVYIISELLPTCADWKVAKWQNGLRKKTALAVSGLCVLMAVGILSVWHFIFPKDTLLPPQEDVDAAQIRQAVQENLSENEIAWIYLVMAGDGISNSHHHHRVFFDLISPNINIRNGFARTQVVIPGLEDPAGTWADELRGNCNFVYLLTVEDALRPVFAELSEDAPEERTLYRVYPAENAYGIELRRV